MYKVSCFVGAEIYNEKILYTLQRAKTAFAKFIANAPGASCIIEEVKDKQVDLIASYNPISKEIEYRNFFTGILK